MATLSHKEIAALYCVDDLPGASIPSARLQNILGCLQFGKPVSTLSLAFLQTQGLETLYQLATGTLSYESFRDLARTEQLVRREAAAVAKAIAEAEERARKAAFEAARQAKMKQIEAARLARESDPKYIAKIKNQERRAQYGLNIYIEPDCFNRLMGILKRVDAEQRVTQEDYVWLASAGERYFTDQLRNAYHRLEADFWAGEFARTRDPWAIVNASSHYRKCHNAFKADAFLKAVAVEQQKSRKLRCALCTTHGGVKRDLREWNEALHLGQQAHTIRPDDYRPCTLLGAIYMETGNYLLGQEWYEKALELGATEDAVDQDLRRIYLHAERSKRLEMREFLLSVDPVRYAWVNAKIHPPQRRQTA